MCHNRQHIWQKTNRKCKQRPAYNLLKTTKNPPLHAMCGHCASGQRFHHLHQKQPRRQRTWVAAACPVPELRGGEGRGRGVSRQVRCCGIYCSSLVSAAAFSGNTLARWRAPRVHRARPKSSRTPPLPLWSVCTVSYLRWSPQRMVAPLLSSSQFEDRGVSIADKFTKNTIKRN